MALSWSGDVAERYATVIAFSIMVGLGYAGLWPRKFLRWAIAGCALIGSIGCFRRLETPFPFSLDPFSVGESVCAAKIRIGVPGVAPSGTDQASTVPSRTR